MNALANLYWCEVRYAEAEPLYLSVHQQRARLPGEEHLDTLRTAFDLGRLYLQQKRWDAAEQLMRRTLDVQERGLGEDHLDTLASLNNRASFYWSR